MKIKDTISGLLNHYPALTRKHGDVLLAAARELSDSISLRVIRAHEQIAACDPDNEAEFNRCVDELDEAERAFLDIHQNTEIAL